MGSLSPWQGAGPVLPPPSGSQKTRGDFRKKSLVSRGSPPGRVGAGGVLGACPNPKKGLRVRAGTPKPRCCCRRLGWGRWASPPLLPQKGSDVLLLGTAGAFWSKSRDFGTSSCIWGSGAAGGLPTCPAFRLGCARGQYGTAGGSLGSGCGALRARNVPAGTAASPPRWHRGRIQAGARPGSQGVINELMQPRYCVISSTQSTPCASSCCYRSLNVAPGGTFGTGTGLGCWGCPGGGCSPVTDPVAGCICWGKGSDPPQCCKSPA